MGWKILTLDDTISYKHWKLSGVQGGTGRKRFLRAAHLEGSPKKHLGGGKKRIVFLLPFFPPSSVLSFFLHLKIYNVYIFIANLMLNEFLILIILFLFTHGLFPEVDTVYVLSKGEKRVSRILFMIFSLVPTSQSQAQNHTDGGSEPVPGLSHLGRQCLRYTMLLGC